MAKLTIRDIARMAGVSTTAVSFVLNNRPGVSEATRQKVMDIIHSTGFTPNVHTRRLNLGKSNTIHVVLRRHGNPHRLLPTQSTGQPVYGTENCPLPPK